MIIARRYTYQSTRQIEDFITLFQTNIENASWTENIKGCIDEDRSFEVTARFTQRLFFHAQYCARGIAAENGNKTTVELEVGQTDITTIVEIVALLALLVLIVSSASLDSVKSILISIGVVTGLVLFKIIMYQIHIENLNKKVVKALSLKSPKKE